MHSIESFENKYFEEGQLEKLKYLRESKSYLGKK